MSEFNLKHYANAPSSKITTDWSLMVKRGHEWLWHKAAVILSRFYCKLKFSFGAFLKKKKKCLSVTFAYLDRSQHGSNPICHKYASLLLAFELKTLLSLTFFISLIWYRCNLLNGFPGLDTQGNKCLNITCTTQRISREKKHKKGNSNCYKVLLLFQQYWMW